jgi:hypothetical protein
MTICRGRGAYPARQFFACRAAAWASLRLRHISAIKSFLLAFVKNENDLAVNTTKFKIGHIKNPPALSS